ncbi:MAG: hypothetical protein IPK74_27875 [Deltaproteobacteria bacterium]|nr:hypothetical protein [Deltaproteobacteria bacterium]
MTDEGDRIEDSLRRLFAPPDLASLQARVEAAAARGAVIAPAPRRTRAIVAAVAAIAVAAVLALTLRPDPDPAPTTSVGGASDIGRTIGLRLAQLHAAGPALPRPDDVNRLAELPADPSCTDAHPRLEPGDALEVLGECGAPSGPPCDRERLPCAHLVHLRDRIGAELLLCIEPRDTDPRPSLPSDADLSIFRRELGADVAYEVTPLPEPHALPQLVP